MANNKQLLKNVANTIYGVEKTDSRDVDDPREMPGYMAPEQRAYDWMRHAAKHVASEELIAESARLYERMLNNAREHLRTLSERRTNPCSEVVLPDKNKEELVYDEATCCFVPPVTQEDVPF